MPGQPKDRTGQVFGRLTVLKSIPENTKTKEPAMCFCRCSCPEKTEKWIRTKDLVEKKVRSCNCLLKEYTDSIKLDITGQKRNQLTVVGRAPARKNGKKDRSLWYCQCDCGNPELVIVQSSKFLADKCISCSECQIKNRRGNRSTRFRGYGEMGSSYFHKLKGMAKKRGIYFDLDGGEVWELFLKQDRKCALTGEPIAFEIGGGEQEKTASLDRIDSSRGYTIDNVQWIHKKVQTIKWNLPEDKFKVWLEKLYNHLIANKYQG